MLWDKAMDNVKSDTEQDFRWGEIIETPQEILHGVQETPRAAKSLQLGRPRARNS